MFTKENGKLFVTVLVAGLAALAIHQTIISPRLVKKAAIKVA